MCNIPNHISTSVVIYLCLTLFEAKTSTLKGIVNWHGSRAACFIAPLFDLNPWHVGARIQNYITNFLLWFTDKNGSSVLSS